jgi:hypothetical protein
MRARARLRAAPTFVEAMLGETDESDWVPLTHAFDLVVGGGSNASVITEWVRADQVEVRAALVKVDGQIASELPSGTWDEPSVNWRASSLRARNKRYPRDWREVEAGGIEVRSSQIRRWASLPEARAAGASAQPLEPRSNVTAKKPEAWQAFWMALIELSQDGRLTPSQFPTQAKLSEEVRNMIGGALSERTVKVMIRQVFNKFIEPQRR